MNRNIPVQVEYDRTNKGVDVRNSSTANFLIDSQDRQGYNATTARGSAPVGLSTDSANFSITKPGQNLISGFFTRLGMTEIVLEWNIFNISTLAGNNVTEIVVRNLGPGTNTTYTVSIIAGNYTVKSALDALLIAINTATSLTFTIGPSTTVAGKYAIIAPAGYGFIFKRATPIPESPAPFQPNLAQALGFVVYRDTAFVFAPDYLTSQPASKPNLLPYKYIDITSAQLASQQKVKDATTSTFDAIDVVYRWVFANDEADPSVVDAYGYPILQGYLPFTSRRYLSFPKQIRWNPILPVGNLDFKTYTDQETILQYSFQEAFEFKMLMLISEV
jgi:hypothetical protein